MALGPEDSALESGEGAAKGWAGVWGPRRGVVVLMAHVARSCLPIAQPAAVTTLGDQGGGPAPCSPTFPMCTLKGLGGCLGLCPREVVSERCGVQAPAACRAAADPEVVGPDWGHLGTGVTQCLPASCGHFTSGLSHTVPPHGALERLTEGAHGKPFAQPPAGCLVTRAQLCVYATAPPSEGAAGGSQAPGLVLPVNGHHCHCCHY